MSGNVMRRRSLDRRPIRHRSTSMAEDRLAVFHTLREALAAGAVDFLREASRRSPVLLWDRGH
jgi:hypothetical protein